MVEVAADIAELGLLGQGKELLHAIVKFVVAGDGDAVADLVHQIDKRLALRHGADGLALDVVAVVNKDDLVALCDKMIIDLAQAGIAEALIDAAVYVAGEEDHDVGTAFDRSGLIVCESHAAHKRADHEQREKQGQEFLCHVLNLFS